MARIAMACIALLGPLVVACSTGKDKVNDTAGTGEIAEVAAGDTADANSAVETVEALDVPDGQGLPETASPQDLVPEIEGPGDIAPDDGPGGPDICQPNCCVKECGDDGCGGSCGSCPEGFECTALGSCAKTGQKSLGSLCFLDEECASGLCLAPGSGNVCSQWCDGACPEGWTCVPFSKTGGDESACVPGCIPDCKGKQCGPDGCGSLCGMCGVGGYCNENGNCLCGTNLLQVQPTCVRVPFSVPPATKFPIAVLAVFDKCIEYDRYYSEWTYGGTEVKIELWGIYEHLFQERPACLYSYLGVIWVNGLPPGTYTIQVGEFPAQQVHVLEGAPPAPECQEECPPALGEGWTATHVSQDPPLELSCGWDQGISNALEFEGSCHDYVIKNDSPFQLPVSDAEVLHCTDTDLLVGWNGDYGLGMTRCDGGSAQLDELLLGLGYGGDGGSAYALLVEKE